MSAETTSQTTGLDLQMERKQARPKVLAKHVADAMGVSSSRLSRIENDPEPVTDRMRGRYLDALQKCRTSGTRAAS